MRLLGQHRQTLSGEFIHKYGERYAQDPGDQSQVEDGDIALTALDRTDESAMQLAALGEFSLRPLAVQTMLADAIAEFTEEVLIAKVHWRP